MTNPTHGSNPFTSLQIRGVLLVLFPAALFAAVAVLTWPLTLKCHPDLGLYFRAAEHVTQGDLPYRDFGFAYPPLALIPCLAPLLFGWGDVSPEMFRWGFLFANAAYLTVIAWVVRSILTQETLDESTPLYVLTLAAGIELCFLLLPGRPHSSRLVHPQDFSRFVHRCQNEIYDVYESGTSRPRLDA